MKSMQNIEQALRDVLPAEFQGQVPELAVSLEQAVAQGASSTKKPRAIPSSPELAAALAALAGKEIATDQAVVSFGSGNQIGNVTIKDIAGGDINHFNIHFRQTTHNHNYHTNYHVRSYRPRKITPHYAGTSQSTRKRTRSSSGIPALSKTFRRRSPAAIARDFYTGFKVFSFTAIGFLFGWSGAVLFAGTYPPATDFTPERFIAGIVTGAIGLLIGMSFTSRRKRASGIAWWGHLVGIAVTGFVVSSIPILSDVAAEMFWVGGVLLWFLIWLMALGGHREFR